MVLARLRIDNPDNMWSRGAIEDHCAFRRTDPILTREVNLLPELMLLRLLSGLTLGSILPNATALDGAYRPPRHQISAMLMVSVGFTAGALLAGFLRVFLIPAFGRRSVFFVGGIIPLVSVFPMVHICRNRIQFLLARNRTSAAGTSCERISQPMPARDLRRELSLRPRRRSNS